MTDKKQSIENARLAFNQLKNPELGSTDYLLDMIRENLKDAGADVAALDPEGKKSVDQMRMEVQDAAKKSYIASARRWLNGMEKSYMDPDTTIPYIQNDLKKAGADEAVLDPEGKKSVDQMRMEIQDATKKTYIASARRWLNGMGKSDMDPDTTIPYIQDDLKKAGVDEAALDPEHKRTADEMKAVIQEKAKAGYIARARQLLDVMANGNLDPDSIIPSIQEGLKKAGVDEAALDPEHKKTADEMKAVIQEKAKTGYIAGARWWLNGMGKGYNDPDTSITYIQDGLKKAGVDEAALDPEHKRTADEMKAVIQEKAKAGYIAKARWWLEDMEKGYNNPDIIIPYIQDGLKKAGVDEAALDPQGKKTADEMKAVIQAKTKESYIKEARDSVESLTGKNPMNPDIALPRIHESLKKAGVDEAALDPQGLKSADQMKAVLEAAIKPAYIENARESLGYLHKNIENADDAIARIQNNLKKAGVDEAALDPEGKKSAEQMREEVQKAAKDNYIFQARKYFDYAQKGYDIHESFEVKLHKITAMKWEKPLRDNEILWNEPTPDMSINPKENARRGKELIEANLHKANVDESVLDPSGKKSAAEMKAELDKLTGEKIGQSKLPEPDDKMQLALAQFQQGKGGSGTSIPYAPAGKTAGRDVAA